MSRGPWILRSSSSERPAWYGFVAMRLGVSLNAKRESSASTGASEGCAGDIVIFGRCLVRVVCEFTDDIVFVKRMGTATKKASG